MEAKEDLILKDECFEVIGACMRVHSEMGSGYLEAVYQECLEIEFGLCGIHFESQVSLKLSYRDRELKQCYKPDFLVYDQILLEIKTCDRIAAEHQSQVLNYLSATGCPLGLLVNFGSVGKLDWMRLFHTKE